MKLLILFSIFGLSIIGKASLDSIKCEPNWVRYAAASGRAFEGSTLRDSLLSQCNSERTNLIERCNYEGGSLKSAPYCNFSCSRAPHAAKVDCSSSSLIQCSCLNQ